MFWEQTTRPMSPGSVLIMEVNLTARKDITDYARNPLDAAEDSLEVT